MGEWDIYKWNDAWESFEFDLKNNFNIYLNIVKFVQVDKDIINTRIV